MTTATITPMMTAVSTLPEPGVSGGGGGGGGGGGIGERDINGRPPNAQSAQSVLNT